MPIESDTQAEDSELGAGESAGAILRRVREERGLEEKQIADHLHITVHYVKAIEADNYAKLPGPIFARGYIKSYAVFLKLDAEDILSRYQALQNELTPDKTQIRSPRRKSQQRNLQWAVASVVLFIALLGGAWFFTQQGVEQGSPVMADEVIPMENDPAPAVSPQQPSSDNDVLGSTTVSDDSNVLEQLATADTIAPRLPPASEVPVPMQTATEPDEVTVDSGDAASNNLLENIANSLVLDEPESQPDEENLPAEPQLSRPEEIAEINVLEGDAGERIIAVDADGSDVLQISFSGESWVEVNDANARQIYRDLREAGDILEISGRAPFNILLGDAPLATLRLNGDDIDVSDDIRIDNSARLTVGL